MPPRKKPTPEENAAKAAKQRERRQNETPDVREKRLAQQREYNLAKRRRLKPTEPDGGAAQSDGRAAQGGLVQRVPERAAFPQTNDGGAEQRQELNEIGVPLDEATDVLNNNDAAIVAKQKQSVHIARNS